MLKKVYNVEQVGICNHLSELTSIQKKMYICNKLPIYRLPLIYEVEDFMTYSAIDSALYQTIKKNHTLQVKYFYEAEKRKFYQKYVPLKRSDFTIPKIEIKGDVRAYIANKENAIDISKEYPWRMKFIETKDKKILYIEFHHICIDGLGIRNFEKAFFNLLLSGKDSEISSDLETYTRINELQQMGRNQAYNSLQLMKLPAEKTVFNSGVGRARQKISNDRLEKISGISKRMNVTKNAVYQGFFEETMSSFCTGEVYGTIGNWRMNLVGFLEVGCFVKIHPKRVVREFTLEDKIKNIFIDNLNVSTKQDDLMTDNLDYTIVYSYEENMFNNFRYIAVDRLCKFDTYFRVDSNKEQTYIEIEYNTKKYTELQIESIYNRFWFLIDSCDM